MRTYHILKDQTLILVNFQKLFLRIEKDCLNTLYKYNLVNEETQKIKLTNRDVRTLIFHHIVYGICEEVTNNLHNYRPVILVQNDVVYPDSQFCNYCSCKELNQLILAFLNKLKKVLPVFIFYMPKSIDFNQLHQEKGEVKELIALLQAGITHHEPNKYTFEPIKKFAKKYNLSFLSKDYFNQLKTKTLIIK